MHSTPNALLVFATIASSLATTTAAAAQDKSLSRDTAGARAIAPVKVTGRIDDLVGIAGSASEGRVGAGELLARPLTREGELLETVPGLIVTQHSGDGKANQYFVRGFNLDHGTDFRTMLDGMPINMPTHAHGQGYTDLNFIIPETVDYLDYRLGVYHAAVGDFGSAGAADFHLARQLRPFGTVGAGENGLARLATGGSTRVGGGDLLLAGELKAYDGAWSRPEDTRKISAAARYSWGAGSSTFSILGLAYRNRWNASDQIPRRAVEGGLISPFGQIDSTDGGHTQRYSLSASWDRVGTRSAQNAQVFAIYSDLTLFSDFGYFLADPTDGDQFSQTEHRAVVGGSATRTQLVQALGVSHTLKVGVQARADLIGGLGLYHTEAQTRIGTVRTDRVREAATGLFAEVESRWLSWFRSVIGLRTDDYAFNVSSDRAANSGSRDAGIVSPKASFVFTPSTRVEFYVSGGFGFHSNDARGTTIAVDPSTGDRAERVDPLVRSRGGEVGLRWAPLNGLRSTISIWRLNLDSELLFTGDGGATEPSAASRRSGVTFANFYRPVPSLSLDADVSLANARFGGVPRERPTFRVHWRASSRAARRGSRRTTASLPH